MSLVISLLLSKESQVRLKPTESLLPESVPFSDLPRAVGKAMVTPTKLITISRQLFFIVVRVSLFSAEQPSMWGQVTVDKQTSINAGLSVHSSCQQGRKIFRLHTN